MKKFLFFILTLPFLGLAQTVPQGINYQAVARDASGAVLVNQSLIVQFSVISDVTTSTVSWQETHTATTNDHGLFTAIIGQGTATSIGNSATFDAINWGASNHLLKVEVDYGNGIFVDMGTTAFLSVPYALSSGSSANALWQDNGGYITNIGGNDVRIDGFSHNIGDGGMFGVNTELHGDRVNLGDGFMGVNTEMGGFRTIIRGGDTRIESPLEVWNDAYFNQNVNIYGDLFAGGQLLSSDRRFKRDIVTVKNALSKVLQLRGVNYYWKQQEFPNRNFDEKLELGLIAQEVELIIPEIVAEAEDGYKAVEYQKLVALLIEAIKEQQTIIEGQKTEMADMRVELDSRLKALEDILTTTTLNTK
ncbi:MAG: tail fiber domain-containing protein [Flavobacteriales bacterium]|nr:tail fiber domain-containing protein [Flavobacteriales bacterium]